jgi:phosphoglycolate phosphatase
MYEGRCKAVLFDLDGTLVNTIGDITGAINAPLSDKGLLPLPEEKVMTLVGHGLKNALHRALSLYGKDVEGVAFDHAYAQLSSHYTEHPVDKSYPYDGIIDMLDSLKVPFGILSNKDDALVQTIVATLFPAVSFSFVHGLREGYAKKPNPGGVLEFAAQLDLAPSQLCYVGDSEVDVSTAGNAGTSCLLCSWGFRPMSALETFGCPVAENVGRLEELLRQACFD